MGLRPIRADKVVGVLVRVGFKLTVPIEQGMCKTLEWFKQVYEGG